MLSVAHSLIWRSSEEQSQVLVNSTTIQNLFVAIWKAQDALVEPIATP